MPICIFTGEGDYLNLGSGDSDFLLILLLTKILELIYELLVVLVNYFV